MAHESNSPSHQAAPRHPEGPNDEAEERDRAPNVSPSRPFPDSSNDEEGYFLALAPGTGSKSSSERYNFCVWSIVY